MNEIRHIHLGRQQYTIAADAYKELHEYLEAIKRHAGREVVEEVELRIAELLTERGIGGDKVVLATDVTYVKEQLGTPTDFSDEVSDEDAEQQSTGEKRLYRDTDNAMIAGVAAGLGKYFRIDPVIIRIIFVALTFAGATGIIIYLLLWILVPEAKTKSDRLKMQGLPINVDTIKDAIARADIEGAAHRASSVVAKGIVRLLYFVLAVIGVGFVAGGIAMALAATTLTIYGLIRGLQVDTVTLFPVGGEQVALVLCGYAVVAAIATLLVSSGITLIKRKWRMPVWTTVGLVAILFAAASAGIALAADSTPRVQERYKSLQHSAIQYIEPVKEVHFLGNTAFFRIVQDSKTGVEIHTFGKVDTKDITYNRDANGVLTIDTTNFHPGTECQLVCPLGNNRTEVVLHLPKAVPFDGDSGAIVTLDMGNYVVNNSADGSVTKATPQPDAHREAVQMPVSNGS